MKKKIYIALLVVLLSVSGWFIYLFLTKTYDPFDVDISSIQLSITFKDYDKELKFAIANNDSLPLIELRNQIEANKSELLDFWLWNSLGIDYDIDSIYFQRIQDLYNDPYSKQMDSLEKIHFEWTDTQEQEVLNGFKRLYVHSSEILPPSSIFLVNSWFGINAIYSNQPVKLPSGVVVLKNEKALVVQKEKYLGKEVALIDLRPEELPPLNQFIHTWISEKYDYKFLQRDIFEAWLETNVFKANSSENDVIHDLIRYGKILYFVQAAIPSIEKSTLLRYSRDQLDWAESREKIIWRYLIENELIFDSKDQTKYNLFYEGPFTPGLNENEGQNNSPDRIGKFIGYQIVKRFMDENASEDYGLAKLMTESTEAIYKNYKPQ